MFLYISVCKFQFFHLTGLFISGHSVLFKKQLCKIQMLRILFLNFPFHFFFIYSIPKTDVLVTCIFCVSQDSLIREDIPAFLKLSNLCLFQVLCATSLCPHLQFVLFSLSQTFFHPFWFILVSLQVSFPSKLNCYNRV